MNDLGGDPLFFQQYPPDSMVFFYADRARASGVRYPIYRDWTQGSDGYDLHLRTDPLVWYTAARDTLRRRDCVLQTGNEPTQDWAALAAWTCKIIEAANQDGQVLGVCAFPTCHPDKAAWAGPLFPILQALQGTAHYLLFHDYVLYSDNPGCVGTFQAAYAVCDEHGLQRPPVIISEYGYDLPGVRQVTGHTDEERAATLAHLWNTLYAPAGVKSACLYAWGDDGDWSDYDMSVMGAFLTALKAATLADPAAIPPVITPEPTPEPQPDGTLVARVAELEQEVDALTTCLVKQADELDVLQGDVARVLAALRGV